MLRRLTKTGIQYLESGIHRMQSIIQDCLGFPYIVRTVTPDLAVLKWEVDNEKGWKISHKMWILSKLKKNSQNMNFVVAWPPLRKVVNVLRSCTDCAHIMKMSSKVCNAIICKVGKGHVLRRLSQIWREKKAGVWRSHPCPYSSTIYL